MDKEHMDFGTLLTELTNIDGPSGFEQEVSAYIIGKLETMGISNYKTDNMGNILVQIDGMEKADETVLFAAHMDEVGYVVRYVDNNGFAYFHNLGGLSPKTSAGQRVRIHTDQGIVYGAMGVRSLHLSSPEERTTAQPLEKMWIDFGATSMEDAYNAGVRPGVYAAHDVECKRLLNNCVVAKATDDRIGCAMLLKLAQKLIAAPVKKTVQMAFTVQEELGLRGASTVVCSLKTYFSQTPDICLSLEGCLAEDYPTGDYTMAPIQLGEGPCIKMMDKRATGNLIVRQQLVSRLESAAKQAGIKYQYDFFIGGTDSDAIELNETGILSGGITVPARYTHSPVEVTSITDGENAVELAYAFLSHS